MFKKKFLFNLLNKGDYILVGLSGGADSVCLFHILNEIKDEYNLTIECAHINHLLRGESADGDMEFVSDLCKAQNIKLHILKKDAAEFAQKNKLSIEESGRIIRYNFFEKIISKNKNGKIATAHTKNDNAETVLFNLIKGNMPLGIKTKRDNIIRPLINVEKSEIIEYLNENKFEYRTDETNFSTDFVRNKIRIDLIPKIKEEFNQNFTNTVYNVSDILEIENNFMDAEVNKSFEKCTCRNDKIIADIDFLAQLHPAILRRLIKKIFYRLSSETIFYTNIIDIENLIKKSHTGKKLTLPDNIIAEISYNELTFYRNIIKKLDFSYELKLNKELIIDEIGISILLSDKVLEKTHAVYEINANYDKLIVRNKKDGDKVFIEKINGHKRISDIFTDKKIPRDEREKKPIFLYNDKIVLIPGLFSENNLKNDKNYLYIY